MGGLCSCVRKKDSSSGSTDDGTISQTTRTSEEVSPIQPPAEGVLPKPTVYSYESEPSTNETNIRRPSTFQRQNLSTPNEKSMRHQPPAVRSPQTRRVRKLPEAELIRNNPTLLFEHLDDKFFTRYDENKLPSDCFTIVRVNLNSNEAKTVLNKFRKTNAVFTVNKLFRIENPYLWCCYKLKKEELDEYDDGPVKEVWLFHGTKSKFVDSICENNLDWRFAGLSKGHRFGQGVNFSPISKYSSHSCDENRANMEMLVVRVLITNTCIGNTNMIVPSNDNSYDTSCKPGGHVIVKYDDSTYYPAYKIIFSNKRARQNNYYY